MRGDLDSGVAAAKTFTKVDNDQVSVFLVSGSVEESEVIAALQNNRGSLNSDTYSLRIPIQRLCSLEIDLRRSQGATGVERLDKMHFDLLAKASSYRKLCSELLARQYDGEEVVRRIEPGLLMRKLAAAQR